MPDPRLNVTVRLSKEGIAAVDKLAEQEDRTRSAMLRLLIQRGLATWGKR